MNQLKKKLSLLIASSAVVLLSGCSTITQMYDAYFMAGYDNVEYALVNKVRTFSMLSIEQCDNEEKTKDNLNKIYGYSLELKNFAQFIPDNQETIKLGANIEQLTKQAKDYYDNNSNISPTFCKLKLQQVIRASEKAQQVIGAKPR